MWSNVALIREYHQNMPLQKAKALTESLLRRFAMEPIAERRNPALTTEERFCAMLLRAAMVRDPIVVLDRPFDILNDHRNGRFLMDALRKVDVFDYSWDKERYGVPDDTET